MKYFNTSPCMQTAIIIIIIVIIIIIIIIIFDVITSDQSKVLDHY